ncbi:MAG TPA: hypothetical protein VH143_30310 [Kofleriaceae bacterium]|jgi:hypothetical protein|nr:hypothetical protein [Kofleriaceae bacterium]
MRFAVLVACAACSSTPTASPTPDAPVPFTFTGDYKLDATITSADVGSASYASGDTIHVDLDFPSYAASQGSGLAVVVVSGTQTGVFAITPQCPSPCSQDPSTETITATLSWAASGPELDDFEGNCVSGSNGCGWAE